ncbi:MAG: UTP--glucose-1-phosphate uridylyltransferase [Gloeobacteraceae cyanobacterium ES-bin-144]|nr:UTP--glucose-1-phosphate uridylyltransferase [Verrucomicrobiales bacterium]
MALLDLITSPSDSVRNQSLDAACENLSLKELLQEADALDDFRRSSENLYHRVRALLFLYSIHRFHLPQRLVAEKSDSRPGAIPFKGYENLLERRFEESIDVFLKIQRSDGANDGISSALASVYQRLAFQTLADQVRRSVRSVSGNQWMFRMGHPADQPLRIRPEISKRDPLTGIYPILRERTPVRMDLTHCGWSDIFFLGMDYPEGAKVLNISIDLAVHGRDKSPSPPVEASLRVIEEPVLRLTSVDLGCSAEISSLNEVFDFAKDYLGLLKAAVIASGIVPPGIEGSGQSLADLLASIVGPGRGLELVSNVNNIPKGSRLAVSTNLLAALISVCMRATGQARSLTGALEENERRIVLARALLGEWIGGSGGGWQDSGGVWPGMKLIQGALAKDGDPEQGVSRGRLMPTHKILDENDVPAEARKKLQDSLVLVHGGMAQNVGPILEMVTEKYLLRSGPEWIARQQTHGILDRILAALHTGDIPAIGKATTENFYQPIQTIIPWASNLYTETLIEKIRGEFGEDFWGFWMLGGMAGGGMGFIFAPEKKALGQQRLQAIMSKTKEMLGSALPFAMEPVVYDFAINERGTWADLLVGKDALMPAGYYSYIVPQLLRKGRHELSPLRLTELDHFAAACRSHPELRGMVQTLFDSIFPRSHNTGGTDESLSEILEQHGFDRAAHEQISADLKAGRIGLAQNRLPANAVIEDVSDADITHASSISAATRKLGMAALKNGEVAVVTLAAGAGSRWTQGAGVVKALHPFCKLGGRHRSFIETHLAKSRKTGREAGMALPHIFTTSYFSHGPTERFLKHYENYHYNGPLYLSQGKSIGLRTVPTVRDLRFAWEEMPQQVLDVQQQKVRESVRSALLNWAESTGEASDYTDNLPLQCLHPVGHWYEVPNLLRNGTLAVLLAERPQLKTLVLHNIDTVGMNVEPSLLGQHLASGAGLSFEVITRRLEDRGGGLALVNGRPQLVEGLAMPREEDEFNLSYYNSNTCWIQIDSLLDAFQLSRAELHDKEKVSTAIRTLAARMPTYITLKDVKKRWGHGQEDVFPVCQFEKLWVDMSNLPAIETRYIVVPRLRGQQLKDPSQLDGWLRDGSAAYLESLCEW